MTGPILQTIFLATGLLLLAVVLLGIKVLFVKGAKFPSGHVHDIEKLRRSRRPTNNNTTKS